MTSYCIICQARGIKRRAAPVVVGVPICVEHRNPQVRAELDVTLNQGAGSAASMVRYAARLSRQAGARPS